MRLIRAAVVLLFVIAAQQAHAANASSSSTTEATREASATFDETFSNGIRNSVEVTVAETQVTSVEGTAQSLQAYIQILQSDTHVAGNKVVDVAGGVNTQPGAFQLNEDLSTASLHIAVPICGAEVLQNGRLKDHPSACFEAYVSLEWTGAAEIVSGSGTDNYQAGDCTVHLISTYMRRDSYSSGAISFGNINFTPDTSISASMRASTRSTNATCPD